jgi:3-oxoadipate enol-lactonase
MFHRCNGIVLHAKRLGDPEKPLVVFSNSLGTDARIWDAVLPHLGDRYRVVLYDKRGHGLSDAPRGPYRIADHAADLLALLDRLGIERFALVGLSVGGMIAQMIAADHPARVAALVLCDTAAKIGDSATWDARIEAVEYKGLEPIATSVLERWFTRDYRARETAAMAGWRNMLTRQPPGGYAATRAAIRDADLRARAGTIAAPTLCLVGDQDLSTPPDLVRGTADLIPDSRFAVIPLAGHIPCVEQPDILAGHIRGHLAEAGWR